MQFPIVREYKTDITGENPENWVHEEPFYLNPETTNRVLIPRKSPFFVETLKLTAVNGEPMEVDKDYRIFKIMSGLTALCSKEVACMVEIINPLITRGLWTYQVVGHNSLIDSTFMRMINDAVNDDRPVFWDNLHNKPLVFPPIWHTHSFLYDIVALKDLLFFVKALKEYLRIAGRHLIQVRMDHILDLVRNYIGIFTEMLTDYLKRHADQYNEHGLTALQVGLEKVDNYFTADEVTVLQPRDDLHVTPNGLGSIIENYGFVPENFLLAEELPISQYGNTNFIPPGIDGSFEGVGSRACTAAICLEGDGSVVMIGNRMDGRIDALYYSVLTNYSVDGATTNEYSGFQYNHPKLIQDGVSPNMIVQGSGDEVILVGDRYKEAFYIGVTNGTLNPAKHVYSKIGLGPLLAAVDSTKTKMSEFLHWLAIAPMGDYCYLIFSHPNGSINSGESDLWAQSLTYKYFWRVKIADIRNLDSVTPERVNVSFQDMDGVQWNNSPNWRWCTRVPTGKPWESSRFLFNFNPPDDKQCRFAYSQLALTCPNENIPGEFVLKFMSSFYCANEASGKSAFSQVEVVYSFNPTTNSMTMIDKIPTPDVNWAANPLSIAILQDDWRYFPVNDDRTGCNVFDDGTVVGSGSTSSGFPWFAKTSKAVNVNSKFSMISKIWATKLQVERGNPFIMEALRSPVTSSIQPRPPFPFPTGELYAAVYQSSQKQFGVFWKAITGTYQLRPGVGNVNMTNLVSRPLTDDIYLVNAHPSTGGCTVSGTSAALAQYGSEIGDSALCMGVQRKYFDRNEVGTWPPVGAEDDVILVDTHTIQMNGDGTVSIIPTHEILYPSDIVGRLKEEAGSHDEIIASPACFVTINDPTGYLTNKFGWLPVTVYITFPRLDKLQRVTTILTIQPTYSNQGARSVVTDYTVTNREDLVLDYYATEQTASSWDAWVSFQITERDNTYVQAPMRTLMYINGNSLDVFMDPAVQADVLGDKRTTNARMSWADRTKPDKKWTKGEIGATSVNTPPKAVTPNNGITDCYPYASSTGGAGIICAGTGQNVLLASMYPKVAWTLYFKSEQYVVFKGKQYFLPRMRIDLRDYDSSPANKTFYIYVSLVNGTPVYSVTTQKRLESPINVWIATAVTNGAQVVTVDRFNVLTLDGHRVTEVKRGNSIPASSGLTNEQGQIPWLKSGEMLP